MRSCLSSAYGRGCTFPGGIFPGSLQKRSIRRADSDSRAGRFPRFAAENLDRNVLLASIVEQLAITKGCTPGQLALAWVLARGEDIVPIPGTKRRTYLEENLAAADVKLTAEDIGWLDNNVGQPAGDRYADMGTVNR
jgi:aryl-alcohol dehydrogenase-like predicted oxidoreductase